SSSDYGYIKFTSGSNSVEFPAVGYRHNSDGTLYNAGAYGYYWASVAYDSSNAYTLTFNSSNVNPQYGWYTRSGLSVRCVR
ncbi:MAG: fibrobacter succinogenes major paralogous domain-containing protein, partial [Rikenellaceae bacterium]|nr:fibrobacter succinogenes major paralogous domain-containing protein [Rikenellaceae bacterium]MDE7355939.1 fibrobacter succinogenes major paralogous domain-containing protein [Rikenellaceae bacterium]